MAEETVVKPELSDRMIAAGGELTKRLTQTDLNLVCALWLYSSDSSRWHLVFASPRVDSDGPLKVYSKIQDVLGTEEGKKLGLDLQHVSVLSPNQPLIRAIRSLFEIEGPSNVRFTRSRINDVFVEDAHIYLVRSASH